MSSTLREQSMFKLLFYQLSIFSLYPLLDILRADHPKLLVEALFFLSSADIKNYPYVSTSNLGYSRFRTAIF